MEQPNRQDKKQGLGDILSQMGQRARQAQQQQPPQQQADDLNVLPLPATQEIIQNCMIVWKWPIDNDFSIVATLYTKDVRNEGYAGDYIVQLLTPGKDDLFEINFTVPEIAKFVGQALISAWNYKNIWKLHAGEFLERELMQPASEGCSPEEPDNG